jgi:hypothetical protein
MGGVKTLLSFLVRFEQSLPRIGLDASAEQEEVGVRLVYVV